MKVKRVELKKPMKNGRGFWRVVYSRNPGAPDGCAVSVRFSRVYDDVEYIEYSKNVSADSANRSFLADCENGYTVVGGIYEK